MMTHIPNVLTIMRILLTLVAIGLAAFEISALYAYLFGIFLVAAASDFADGYLARRYNVVSDFGKVFDPLADKVLTFVFLVLLYDSGIIPPLIILLLIVRDLTIDNVRAFFATKVIVPAIFTAKAKTVAIFALIASALYTLAFDGNEFWYTVTFWTAIVSLTLAYISAAQYARIFYRAYKIRRDLSVPSGSAVIDKRQK